jgi:hypothetical protein
VGLAVGGNAEVAGTKSWEPDDTVNSYCLIANIDCLFDVNLGSSQSRIARHPFMTLIGVACVGMTGNTSESLASGNNRWRSQICASTVR